MFKGIHDRISDVIDKLPDQVGNKIPVVASIDSSALPTGASTSAKQDTQITAEQAILAKIIAAPATEAKQDAGNVSLASIDVKFPAQSGGKVPVVAATSDALLAAIQTLLQTTGITLLPLDSSIDSIDVDKMTKGAVTVAHSAITATATSAEIDCRGYNSLLVHWVSSATDKTWVISVTGAMGSGLTFVPLLDKVTGLAASEITTDISGFFVISNIPDYVKIVATETDDGATVTCKVQPFNQ